MRAADSWRRILRLGVGVLSVTVIGVRVAAPPRRGRFWDLNVYARAPADVLGGSNPYRTRNPR